jgi:hypothetical protein
MEKIKENWERLEGEGNKSVKRETFSSSSSSLLFLLPPRVRVPLGKSNRLSSAKGGGGDIAQRGRRRESQQNCLWMMLKTDRQEGRGKPTTLALDQYEANLGVRGTIFSVDLLLLLPFPFQF